MAIRTKSIEISPVVFGEIVPDTERSVSVKTQDSKEVCATGAISPAVENVLELPATNLNPLRRRVFDRRRINWGWLGKFIKFIWNQRPWRPLTTEEKRERDEKRARKEMAHLLESEARTAARLIQAALTRQDICYWYRKTDNSPMKVRPVVFSAFVGSPDALYLKVDTRRLPHGVTISKLIQDEVALDLSLTVGRRVVVKYSEVTGVWYIVERATGVMGIPRHVMWQDMISAYPKSADGLSIPIGITTNNRHVYKSLGSMYNMLVGGTIGAGKSNMLNVLLCSLISRNAPSRLELVLIDLKGGLEFSAYRGIPHLMKCPAAPDGIVTRREAVPDLLDWIIMIGEKRMETMLQSGEKEIGRYNQRHRKEAMSHIVVVADEWADLKLDPQCGKKSNEKMINIASRYRAVGIHVILCTQVPKSEIVDTRIKGVLPAKIAFSCPSNQSSMAIIDHGGAAGLSPAGRCIFVHTKEMEIQTPYLNDEQIFEIVRAAKEGKTVEIESKHDVTPLEVMSWALDYDNGYLSRRKIYQQFHDRHIPENIINDWLNEWEGQEYVIGSSVYRVVPSNGGNKPRRLIALDQIEKEKDNG